MHITTLNVQNYRFFEKEEFTFNPKFNLVIGRNGSGKTALLNAIVDSLINIAAQIGNVWSITPLAPTDVRLQQFKFESQIRYERIYPCSATASGEIFGEQVSWGVQKVRETESPTTPQSAWGVIKRRLDVLETSEPFILPIIAFYPAQRVTRNVSTSIEQAASEKLSRLSAYTNWYNASASPELLENWIIGKTLERLQKLQDGSYGPSSEDELEIVNTAIAFCIPRAKELRYDLTLRALTFITLDGVGMPFNELSDGQRSMISLIADIARRMCLLNPQLGNEVLTQTNGIVLIDELDVHLHPQWQRQIVWALRKLFPAVQFIASSHSPQMIGGLEPSEVMVLQDGHIVQPQFTFGLDASRILEDVMGTDAREPSIEEQLNLLFRSIEEGDLDKAKDQLSELMTAAPGLADYSQASALIRRKEMLKR